LTKEEKPDLIDEYRLINRIQEDERTKKTINRPMHIERVCELPT